MDCRACQRHRSRRQRRVLGCGWLSDAPEPEPAALALPEGAPEQIATVCPGYSVTLPEVHETSRAHSWRETGLLRERYEVEGWELSPALFRALEILGDELGSVRHLDNRRMRARVNR